MKMLESKSYMKDMYKQKQPIVQGSKLVNMMINFSFTASILNLRQILKRNSHLRAKIRK